MHGRATRRVTYRTSLATLLAISAAFSAPPAALASPEKAWTNVGCVGVVDDANQSQVFLDLSRARLAAGVVSATIRYNVTATEGLFLGPDKKLTVRFYKPDNFSVVTARLWSDEIATGTHSSLMLFDSAGFLPNAAATQAQSVTFNLPNEFDFGKKVYWVEVVLTRLRNAQGVLLGDPRLELLQIVTQ
jgi:hypothetical protein